MRIVFSAGKWLTVNLPKGHDPCWSPSDSWYYATTWAACLRKGLDEKKATVLAEAATAKRMYPEIMYDSVLEKELEQLFE